MMMLLRVLCSSSSMRDDSRVLRVLAISGLTRSVRLGASRSTAILRASDLNDDAFACALFEFFDEGRLAGLKGFGDFRIDAQRQAGGVEIDGHFAGFRSE